MIKRICGCDCCTCECIDCVEGELTKEDENNFCDKHQYYMGDECPFCKKENQVKDNQLLSPAKPDTLYSNKDSVRASVSDEKGDSLATQPKSDTGRTSNKDKEDN